MTFETFPESRPPGPLPVSLLGGPDSEAPDMRFDASCLLRVRVVGHEGTELTV